MSINEIKLPQNLTASSILSKSVETQKEPKETKIDTADKLELNADKKADFKKPSFPKMTPEVKEGARNGAIIGGIAGGIAGGITAYSISMHHVRATEPYQSVSLEWQEPIMEREFLGRIPSDYYSYSSTQWGGPLTSPVYRYNPVQENGKPVMQQTGDTFSGYGQPEITWKPNTTEQKVLTGYYESVSERSHTESVRVGTDSDGKAIYEDRKVIDGYDHSFSPTFKHYKLGVYHTPRVDFKTQINVGANTLIGIAGGIGLGALTGAIIGGAVAHAKQNDSETKA